MSRQDWLTGLLAVLLGTGGIGSLVSTARGIGALRTGVRARQREAVADLAKSRDEAEDRARRANDRADRAESDRDFWRDVAGGYAFQLTRAGKKPDPEHPSPPSRPPPRGGRA